MGFTSASEILQRVMSSILSGLPGVRWVHDDIIVYGKDLEQHNSRLRECFSRLRQWNVTLNHRKCRFATKDARFLSMHLSAAGISPTKDKLEAINAFKPPNNPTEIRSFLGLVMFVAKFVPNLADRALPLRKLTKKNEAWVWGPLQEAAFNDLKDVIANSKSLAFFDCNLKTQLIVDASPTGVGAILAQTQGDGATRPVAYASRSLSPTEQRYSQTEREALAVKYGCLKFHHYLSGSKFQVFSDHKPLVELFSSGSRPPPRIERMALRLQDLHFSLQYRPGDGNPADVLSRQPLPLPPDNVGERADANYIAMAVQAAEPASLTLDAVRRASEQDRVTRAAINAIHSGTWDLNVPELRRLRGVQHELSEHNDILLKGSCLFIPTSLRYTCLRLAHQGHQGVRKTLERLQRKVWWPGMRASVETYVAACISCASCNNDSASKATPLKPTELPDGPWQQLGMDFLGPIRGKMILVCTDHFSRFPLVEIFPGSTGASSTVAVLRKWFGIFGQPLKVTTDNGPPFNSLELAEFFRSHGVRHHRTTPLYPEANGATERCNKGLNKAIRAALAEGKHWTAAVDEYLAAYRRTPHTSTGAAPAELLFGRQLIDSIPSLHQGQPVDNSRATIAGKDASAKRKMKEYADLKRRASKHNIRAGDTVLRRRSQRRKTDTLYETLPWTVSNVTGDALVMRRGDQNCKRHVTDVRKIPSVDFQHEASVPSSPESSIASRSHPRQVKNPDISYRELDLRKSYPSTCSS